MSAKKRILVVDDEPYILKSMQYLLEDEYEIITASNGKEALALLEQDAHYNLIISDLSMPEMNGAEFYLNIVKLYPHLEKSFIFMTGGMFGGYLQESLVTKTHPCITKPFENEALHATIKKFFQDLG